jgi:hypothetical protein
MPAVDPKKLKRLMITDVLAPYAMRRGLSRGQLDDLVQRAMEDKRFDLCASSDEFADHFMDEAQATDWAQEFERSNKAPHIFPTSQAAKSEENFGGYPISELEKMKPEQRLAIANKVERERAKKN